MRSNALCFQVNMLACRGGLWAVLFDFLLKTFMRGHIKSRLD
jgi:hypothetical protein